MSVLQLDHLPLAGVDRPDAVFSAEQFAQSRPDEMTESIHRVSAPCILPLRDLVDRAVKVFDGQFELYGLPRFPGDAWPKI